MPLEIVVCVKYTPASTSIAVDPSGAVKTEGLPHGINPFDEYAIEEALRIKERVPGSKVTAMTLGKPASEQVLRDALALGCDEAVLLSDPSFDGSDNNATAYLLSAGIRKKGNVQLVLCGKQTNDGESGHVGPGIAAWLDWPSASSIRKIPEISDAAATVERLMEDGTDTLKLQLPAVLSVTKEINEPRLPSLKGKMAAKKAAIPAWKAGDLSADAGLVGGNSPTAVAKTSSVPSRPSGMVIPGGTPEEKAHNLVEKLKEAKFI